MKPSVTNTAIAMPGCQASAPVGTPSTKLCFQSRAAMPATTHDHRHVRGHVDDAVRARKLAGLDQFGDHPVLHGAEERAHDRERDQRRERAPCRAARELERAERADRKGDRLQHDGHARLRRTVGDAPAERAQQDERHREGEPHEPVAAVAEDRLPRAAEANEITPLMMLSLAASKNCVRSSERKPRFQSPRGASLLAFIGRSLPGRARRRGA